MIACNRAIVAGNLCREIELKYTATHVALTKFTLAVNRSVRQQDGTYKDEADFVPVEAWGRLAENCEKYLKKGDTLLVEGRVATSSYETKAGEKRYDTRVVAEAVKFPSRAMREENKAEQQAAPYRQRTTANGGYRPRQNDWAPMRTEEEPVPPKPARQEPSDVPF